MSDPITLTPEQFAVYDRALRLIGEMEKNPEARSDLQRGVKKIVPTFVTEEDQREAILAPLREELSSIKETLTKRDESEAEAKRQRDESEAMQRLEDGFSRLRDHHGLQPAGEEKVRELMKERGVYDPEAAFALWERQNPKPKLESSSYTPQSWNIEADLMPDAKDWFVNTDEAEERAIGQVLVEMRRERE